MSKSWKKILVTGASLLMFASVSAGTSQVVHPAHAEAYTQQLTGSLKHSIRFGHHFYRKGSPVYGAQSLGDPTHMYVYLGHDTVDQRYIPDSYYSHSLPVHHHHRRLAHHYRRPVRRHYRKHARKYYRRMAKKAKPRKAHKHYYIKHNRKTARKATRSRKNYTRKQRPYLRMKHTNHKTTKGNSAYKKGYYLGSYFNASARGEDYIGNKIYKNISYQPRSNKAAFFKGYMAAAAPKSVFGNDKYGRNEVKNSINAWKHNLANQNNSMFQRGVKDDLKMDIDQKNFNIPSDLKNNSDYRDGFKTAIIYLDGATYNANHVLNNSLKYSDAI